MLDDLIEKGVKVQTVCSHLLPQDCHVLGQSKPDSSGFHQFKVPGGRVRAVDRLPLLIRCGERYRLVSHRNSLELARVQSRPGAREKTKHKSVPYLYSSVNLSENIFTVLKLPCLNARTAQKRSSPLAVHLNDLMATPLLSETLAADRIVFHFPEDRS
jgi:hypothetical protein